MATSLLKKQSKAPRSAANKGSHHTGLVFQRDPRRAIRSRWNRLRAAKTPAVITTLALGLIAAILWSVAVGQFGASAGQSLRSLAHIVTGLGQSTSLDVVLWEVRLPRVSLAAIVGAGLAISGLALQAVFANPLAEPGLIGVSSGAAVGASLATVLSTASAAGALGLSSAGLAAILTSNWTIAVAAFVGGIAATAVVAASARGSRDIARIILVGVAVNAVCGGIVSFLTYIASTTARDRIVFWQMGSFASADWSQVGIVLALTTPAAALLWVLAPKLDILSLGDSQAQHLGIDVVALRRVVIAIAALVVAAGVAFSGIIVFIGLVVPHALRLLIGPGHRALVPACFLGGALAATLADLAARALITGTDLPLGMLTSIVGGPIFFWLLIRSDRSVKH